MITFSLKKRYKSKKFPPAAGIKHAKKNWWSEHAKKKPDRNLLVKQKMFCPPQA